METSNLYEKVIGHFEAISAIPRGSGNEKEIAEYLVKWAGALGFEVSHQTGQSGEKAINNVIIKKKGTTGCEELPPVALQAHLDMVCQKTADSKHDFTKAPIVPLTDGDIMYAKDTTLGADDGIGVACAMAILESTDCPHPPLEVIFTSDEEDGMSGADSLDMNLITAERLINIDTEQEGKFFYGCAGGSYAQIDIPVARAAVPSDAVCYTVTVSGLLGGHSGLMIGEKRANANRLLGRALDMLRNRLAKEDAALYLYEISGGTARNAIPNKAVAVIAVKTAYEGMFKSECEEIKGIFTNEYQFIEKTLEFAWEPADLPVSEPMNQETLKRVVTAMTATPLDVIAMHGDVEGLVETSCNMGIVEQKGGTVSVSYFVRSCIASKKHMVIEQFKLIAESIGAGFVNDNDFPEWEPNPSSQLKALFEDTYSKVFPGKEAETLSIHAGLECGYFAVKRRNMDIMAIGPTIEGAHTTKEKLYLSTVGPVITLLAAVLERMANGDVIDMAPAPQKVCAHNGHFHGHDGHVCVR